MFDQYNVSLEQLVQFEASKGEKVLIEKVDADFYYEFVDYLVTEHNNVNKTFLRKIRRIQTVMTYGLEKLKIVQHLNFKQKLRYKDIKESNRQPLLSEERKAFWDYKTDDEFERMICDAFIIDMYTGLRYGDLKKLRSTHIREFSKNGENFKYIDFSQQKTINANSIPIPTFVYGILERYIKPNANIFKMPYNMSANRVLKRIAGEDGLKLNRTIIWRSMKKSELIEVEFPLHEKLSFHFGRYTYTRILDETELQERDIQKNLGHRKFATTEGYLKSDDMRRLVETFKAVAK